MLNINLTKFSDTNSEIFLRKCFNTLLLAISLIILSPLFLDDIKLYPQIYKIAHSFILLSISYFTLVFISKRHTFKIRTLDTIIIVFYIIFFIQSFFHYETITIETFWGNISIISFYILFRISDEVFSIRKILYLFFSITLLQIYFEYKHANSLSHITGSFININIWAFFLTLNVIVLIFNLIDNKSNREKITYTVLLILYVFIIYMTLSRASWLCLLVSTSFILYKKITLNKSQKLFYFIIVFFFIVFLSIILLQSKKASTNGRKLILHTGIEMLKTVPLTGFGSDGFQKNYMLFQSDYLSKIISEDIKLLADENKFCFNEYLRLIIEYGILFILFLFVIFYFIIFENYKNLFTNEFNILMSSLILSFLVFALFSYPFKIYQLKFLFIILLSSIAPGTKLLFEIKSSYIIRLLFLFSIINTCIFMPYAKATRDWSLILKGNNYRVENIEDINNYLKNDYTFQVNIPFFLEDNPIKNEIIQRTAEYFPTYASYNEMANLLKRKGDFVKAEFYWNEASKMVPNRFKPLYHLMIMHEENHKMDIAAEIANKIISKQIKIKSLHVQYYLNEANRVNNKYVELKSNL